MPAIATAAYSIFFENIAGVTFTSRSSSAATVGDISSVVGDTLFE